MKIERKVYSKEILLNGFLAILNLMHPYHSDSGETSLCHPDMTGSKLFVA